MDRPAPSTSAIRSVVIGGSADRLNAPPILRSSSRDESDRKVKQLHSVSLPAQASKFLPPTLSPTGCPYSYSPTWTPTRRDLVGSLVNEAVVTENGILEVVPGTI